MIVPKCRGGGVVSYDSFRGIADGNWQNNGVVAGQLPAWLGSAR